MKTVPTLHVVSKTEAPAEMAELGAADLSAEVQMAGGFNGSSQRRVNRLVVTVLWRWLGLVFASRGFSGSAVEFGGDGGEVLGVVDG